MATSDPDLGEAHHKSCSTCPGEALSFCQECDKYFCATCLPVHKSLLTGHTVLGDDQRSEWGKKKEKKKWMKECDEHAGQMTCMYCSKHDIVCCPVCAVQKHSLGYGCYLTVSYIPDIAKGLSSSQEYQTHLESIDKVTTRFNAAEQKLREKGHTKLHDSKVKGTEIMKELIERIDKMLNDLMNESLKKLEEMDDGLELGHEKEIDEIVTYAKELEVLKKESRNAENSAVELFICMKTSQKQIDKLNETLDVLENQYFKQIKFSVDDKVEKAVKLLDKAKSLGTLQSTNQQYGKNYLKGDGGDQVVTTQATMLTPKPRVIHRARRRAKTIQKTSVSSSPGVSTTSNLLFGISATRSMLKTTSQTVEASSTITPAHGINTTIRALSDSPLLTSTRNSTHGIPAIGSFTLDTSATRGSMFGTPTTGSSRHGGSATGSSKPGSPVADSSPFGSTMNNKSHLNAWHPRGIRTTGNSSQTKNSPLLFHREHGKCVELSDDSKQAKRSAVVFAKSMGICFSNRPIAIGERLCIKFEQNSLNTNSLTFGLTRTHPESLNFDDTDLRDLGSWISMGRLGNLFKTVEGLPKDTFQLFLYVNIHGDVFYGVDDNELGWLFHGIETNVPLWALIDVSALVLYKSIELIKANLQEEGDEDPDPKDTHTSTYQSTAGQQPLAELESKDARKDHRSGQYSRGEKASSPLYFHSVCVKNLSVSYDKIAAIWNTDNRDRGYVFTTRPMEVKETIVVEVQAMCENPFGFIYLGFTSCDPATLRSEDLPDQESSLLERPEYWVLSSAKVISELETMLHLYLTQNGKVQCCEKKRPPFTMKNHTVLDWIDLDTSKPLWAFFVIDGGLQNIRLIDRKDETRPPSVPSSGFSSSSSSRFSSESTFSTVTASSALFLGTSSKDLLSAAAPTFSNLEAKNPENVNTAQTPTCAAAAPAFTPILGGFSFISPPNITEPKAEKAREGVKAATSADAPMPFSRFFGTSHVLSPAKPMVTETKPTSRYSVLDQVSTISFGSFATGDQAVGDIEATIETTAKKANIETKFLSTPAALGQSREICNSSFGSLSAGIHKTAELGTDRLKGHSEAKQIGLSRSSSRCDTATGSYLQVGESEPNVNLKAAVRPPAIIDLKTGEKDKQMLLEKREKLFCFVRKPEQWLTRGVEESKMHKTKKYHRVLKRRENVLKLCAKNTKEQNAKSVIKKTEKPEKKTARKVKQEEITVTTSSFAASSKPNIVSWTCSGCYSLKPGDIIDDLPKKETPFNTRCAGSSGFSFESAHPLRINSSGGFKLAITSADSTSKQGPYEFRYGSRTTEFVHSNSAHMTGGFIFGSLSSTTSSTSSGSPFAYPVATLSTQSSPTQSVSSSKFGGDTGKSSETPNETTSFDLRKSCESSSGFTFGEADWNTTDNSTAASKSELHDKNTISDNTFGETSKSNTDQCLINVKTPGIVGQTQKAEKEATERESTIIPVSSVSSVIETNGAIAVPSLETYGTSLTVKQNKDSKIASSEFAKDNDVIEVKEDKTSVEMAQSVVVVVKEHKSTCYHDVVVKEGIATIGDCLQNDNVRCVNEENVIANEIVPGDDLTDDREIFAIADKNKQIDDVIFVKDKKVKEHQIAQYCDAAIVTEESATLDDTQIDDVIVVSEVKVTADQNTKNDDVIFVKEETATIDEISKARDLQLPDHFFLYRRKPGCTGCRGCKEDLKMTSNQADEDDADDYVKKANEEEENNSGGLTGDPLSVHRQQARDNLQQQLQQQIGQSQLRTQTNLSQIAQAQSQPQTQTLHSASQNQSPTAGQTLQPIKTKVQNIQQQQQQLLQQQQPTQQQRQSAQPPKKKGLSLTRQQKMEAQEMFKISNKVTRPEKALILGFMAGSRENPCPQNGNILSIRLNETKEIVTQADPTQSQKPMLVETFFRMNYSTGEWRRQKKYRELEEG